MASQDLVSQLGLPADFPTFFPPQLEQYRRSIAEGADAPDEFAIAYMLAAAATATGGDVSACVQPGWYVRANLFFAVIGYKGSSKSTLADKCFAPLVHREEELRMAQACSQPGRGSDASSDDDAEEYEAEYDDGYGDDEDDEEDEYHDASYRGEDREQADPCLLINDCTGPALLQLLDDNRRQLLVNPDEMSRMFTGGKGTGDRATWCELYDGRRRRRERASTKAGCATLTAPYMNLIGGIQPELLTVLYNVRGDDGLLDRVFLVGDGVMREAGWPRETDDPILNTAWSTAMSRLLRIEEYAEDAIGQQVESQFTPAALEVCKGLLQRLNNLVVVLAVPHAQRGIVKKLVQHAVKLALLHRCLRWAAGEFGDRGPLGKIDADDATAARDATLFFLGRWLVWRKELRGSGKTMAAGPIGLSMPPGNDPALQALAGVAAGAQRGVGIIERVVRLLRDRGAQPIAIPTVALLGAMPDVPPIEIRDACDWLVEHGHAEWKDASRGTFSLREVVSSIPRKGQERVATAKEGAK